MSSGYETELEYTYQYFDDWAESKLTFLALNKKIHLKSIINACELGFGQGVTLNVLGCCTRTTWYGTDFNDKQHKYASQMASEVENNANLSNLTFDDFAKLPNLPNFDLIVLHGIFSWVSAENQKIIIKFIDEHLNEGGVVYLSYNSRPGIDGFRPTQYLMNQVRKYLPSGRTSTVKEFNEVLKWMSDFHKTDPSYLKMYPGVESRINTFKDKDIRYLIHEYFNDDWFGFYFSEIADKLNPIGLKYLGQSRLQEEIPLLNFTENQLAFLKDVKHPLDEDIKDTMMARSFRRDLWVRAPKQMSNDDIKKFLQSQKIILALPLNAVSFVLKGHLLQTSLSEPLCKKIIDLISDYQFHSLSSLVLKIGISEKSLFEILILLSEKNIIALVQSDEIIPSNRAKCILYNSRILSDVNLKVKTLAMPLIGAGCTLDITSMVYCQAIHFGLTAKDEILKFVVDYYIKNNLGMKITDGIARNEKDLAKALAPKIEVMGKYLLPFVTAHEVIAS